MELHQVSSYVVETDKFHWVYAVRFSDPQVIPAPYVGLVPRFCFCAAVCRPLYSALMGSDGRQQADPVSCLL